MLTVVLVICAAPFGIALYQGNHLGLPVGFSADPLVPNTSEQMYGNVMWAMSGTWLLSILIGYLGYLAWICREPRRVFGYGIACVVLFQVSGLFQGMVTRDLTSNIVYTSATIQAAEDVRRRWDEESKVAGQDPGMSVRKASNHVVMEMFYSLNPALRQEASIAKGIVPVVTPR
jgi:hypothetical protein